MKIWKKEEIGKILSSLSEIKIQEERYKGEDYTTDGFILDVNGTEENLYVRGFITSGKPLKTNDNVEIEMVEVTTGYSDGNMPNDPALCIAHGIVKAALMKAGFSVVDSLDPYF